MRYINERAAQITMRIEKYIFSFLVKQQRTEYFTLGQISNHLLDIEEVIEIEILQDVVNRLLEKNLVIRENRNDCNFYAISSIGRKIDMDLKKSKEEGVVIPPAHR